jgi:hypothetical protein
MHKFDAQSILVLIENEEQYKSLFKSDLEVNKKDLVVLALSMSVINFCKNNNINYLLPDDLISEDKYNNFDLKSQKKIRELIVSLNKYYHSTVNTDDNFLFDMGNYHFYMLNHFFSSLHYRAFFLSEVIKAVNPLKIIVFKYQKLAINKRFWPIVENKNCYYELLMNSEYSYKVAPLSFEEKNTKTDSNLTPRRIVSRLLRSIPIVDAYLTHLDNGIKMNFFKSYFYSSKSDILLIGIPGPWKYFFLDSFKVNRLSIYFGRDEVNPNKLNPKNWFYEWFLWSDNFCGFDVAALGYFEMDRVKVLSTKIIKFHKQHKKILEKKKITLYSVCPYPFEQYMLSVAKHLNIPRVCYQHGAMAMRTFPMQLADDASELQYTSHYFSYGEQVSIHKEKEALLNDGFKKAISVGSVALEQLKGKEFHNSKYILYCSSKFLSNANGFVGRNTDINRLNNQNNLINYFNQLDKDEKVIWKLNQEFLTEQPDIKVGQNIKTFLSKPSFTDLIADAKMIILDTPSTTCLEVCMTEKPLFILLTKKYFYSHTESLLRKRAVVVETPDDLLEAVKNFISEGIYPADIKNKEFLKEYGVYKNDNNAVHRVEKNLDIIMAETK